ncbi:hypothetical protein H5410_020797 [Solanum commersonii]|uniref:Secreted protein n=1 Tax=Solanum commersonii TaxID=4109 RepID=A0A9J5ZDC1_SOLCO|nr:hypothetical protein H5410_020797 [Solanum commersonii]
MTMVAVKLVMLLHLKFSLRSSFTQPYTFQSCSQAFRLSTNTCPICHVFYTEDHHGYSSPDVPHFFYKVIQSDVRKYCM